MPETNCRFGIPLTRFTGNFNGRIFLRHYLTPNTPLFTQSQKVAMKNTTNIFQGRMLNLSLQQPTRINPGGQMPAQEDLRRAFYQCSVCQYVCFSDVRLQAHMESMHPEVLRSKCSGGNTSFSEATVVMPPVLVIDILKTI